jgi:hypothetical protein
MSHDAELAELRKAIESACALAGKANSRGGLDWDRIVQELYEESREDVERLIEPVGKLLSQCDWFAGMFLLYFFIHRQHRQVPAQVRGGLPRATLAISRLAEDAAVFTLREEGRE